MSHLFGRTVTGNHHTKSRRTTLPSYTGSSSSSAIQEKLSLDGSTDPSGYFTTISIPIPSFPTSSSSSSSKYSLRSNSNAGLHHQRRIRLTLPIPPRIYHRLPKLTLRLGVAFLGLVMFLFFMLKGKGGRKSAETIRSFIDPSTLIFGKDEVKGVWEWEVMSGHWPSKRKVPMSNLPAGYLNPAVPLSLLQPPQTPQSATGAEIPHLIGSGPERTYLNLSIPLDPKSQPIAFPHRPVAGSTADLDMLMDHCDFGRGLFVRDCLEVLRVGGGLDNGKRTRRGNLKPWSYVYTEDQTRMKVADDEVDQRAQLVLGIRAAEAAESSSSNIKKNKSATPIKEKPTLHLPAPLQPRPLPPTISQPCDSTRPRLFHIFWAGPFTDKPYMAIMSFLYTQNIGLDLSQSEWSHPADPPVCRPQFLVWINPGHAASVPNPTVKREMFEALATNPWSAPFLHPRFKDIVKFKLWNTTEQLDGVPELKDHWRNLPILNSGGQVKYVPPKTEEEAPKPAGASEGGAVEDLIEAVNDGIPNAEDAEAQITATVGNPTTEQQVKISVSKDEYDPLSTVLSDMVRFVLLHRFGGIYLDADTLFLRDWEELWNWKGAFAYRWSWHEKYNTAIIKMHKGSALTSFLFKTALENKLDFHPMTISRYLADAGLDPLLYRLPDALFDSAWLNMEGYQRERPPFPYFSEFKKFFVGDKHATAEPQPAGFDSFFRGAWCYHYHNNWWLPFDPSRNWPDLGARFARGEKLLRTAIAAAKKPPTSPTDSGALGPVETSKVQLANKAVSAAKAARAEWDDEIADDDRDLSWSTVLKRTFEAFIRGEAPNMYGEWINWEA